MTIRLFQKTDYEQAYALWTREEGVGMRSLDDSFAGIAKYLDRNPGTCFVAEEEGRIIGTILSGHDGRRGYIYHAMVDGTKRRGGIGKKLVERAMEALKKEGINKVAFVAFKKNTGGNAFWQALGFEERQDLVYRNKTLNEENR